nr:fenitrothion hydrolase [Actinomycetota bacterium]
PLVESDPELADLLGMGFNLVGLLAAILLVSLAYQVAVAGAQAVAGRDVSFEGVFVGSLIPIALVYAVAHYFSLFVSEGQYALTLLSDPLGRGWDLLGTADLVPDRDIFSPNTVWYIQVAVLVAGHVVGLVVAHDRALALVPSSATAARTQYAMLALMVLYTVGGMWLLSLQ